MPGEPEERAVAKRRRTGLPMSDDVVRDLRAEVEKARLTFPAGSADPLDLS